MYIAENRCYFYVVVLCFTVTLCQSADDVTNDPPNFDSPVLYQVTEPFDHSEEPTWDPRKNNLYFVDIHSGRIFSYNYDTKKLNFITVNGDVTPVIPSKNDPNLFIVGVNRTLIGIEWDGVKELGLQKVLASVSEQFPTSRFNDGKADKQGRLWIGTMGYESSSGELTPNQGVFYKITKDNLDAPLAVVAPVNISNGLAWNKANNKLYYIDTPTRKIAEYDYDDEKGEIKYVRTAFDLSSFPKIGGNPDGMTIDEEDHLWVALYGGGCVIRVNPKTGDILKIVPIPARDVTSVMFGGPNLDVLFVTTSRVSLNENERKQQPAAGAVFAVSNLGVKGVPVFNADIVDTIKRKNIITEISEILTGNDINASNLNNQPRQRSQNTPLWMTMLNTLRNIF